MSFTESNTVEQMILDAATSFGSSVVRDDLHAGRRGELEGVFQWSKAIESAIR
jgi:hypothetical protein